MMYELLIHQHRAAVTTEHSSHVRIRIAILDTGYDPESILLHSQARSNRLKKGHWKDFVAGSMSPIDEDGHGSCVQSLVMQLAPFADIYVARIARRSEGLETSEARIAKVCR